jgi:hypothetical protein
MSVAIHLEHLFIEVRICPRTTLGAKMKHDFASAKKLIFTITLSSAMFGAAQSQTTENAIVQDRHTLANLTGIYASTAPEPWYGAWGTREFKFDNGNWSLNFVFALDSKMQMRVFEFRTVGTYYLGVQSKDAPKAFNALFTEDAKFVTLLTKDTALANKFGFGACGLTLDVEKDISISGCANWRPVAVCGQDHDLLALDSKGGLNFGVRPMDNDMCTSAKRPKALLPAVFKR